MADAPKITIGVPVRNGEKLLPEALDSILAQILGDFEVIVSDNASTDGTVAVAEAYAARDARIRVVRHAQNHGAAWNFSHTLGLARGRYFKWLAADDLIEPAFLERTAAVLDADPAVVLAYPQSVNLHVPREYLYTYADVMPLGQATASERFAEHRRRITADVERLGSHPITNAIYGLTRLDVLRATNALGTYVGWEDVLLGELALRGKIVEIPEQLASYRQHGGSPWAHDGTNYDAALFLDPANAGRLSAYAPTWAQTAHYLEAIRCAPLAPKERNAAMAALLRTTPFSALSREAAHVASRFVGLRPWNRSSRRRLGPPRPAGA